MKSREIVGFGVFIARAELTIRNTMAEVGVKRHGIIDATHKKNKINAS